MTRWKGDQAGDIVIPFGNIGGALGGMINCNQSGDIWVAVPDDIEEARMTELIKSHEIVLQKAYRTPLSMAASKMLIHEDYANKCPRNRLPEDAPYIVPPELFRVHETKSSFSGAEHLLVIQIQCFVFLTISICLGIYTQNAYKNALYPKRMQGPRDDRFFIPNWWMMAMGRNYHTKQPFFVQQEPPVKTVMVPAECSEDESSEDEAPVQSLGETSSVLAVGGQKRHRLFTCVDLAQQRMNQSRMKPLVPIEWTVVYPEQLLTNGEQQYFIEVKFNVPDDKAYRLEIIGISMVPVFQVDLYRRLYDICDARFVLRVLVPAEDLDVSLRDAWTNWLDPAVRRNKSFRNNHSAVIVLTSRGFQGFRGCDDVDIYHPIKSIIESYVEGENDAVIRYFIRHFHMGFSGSDVLCENNLRAMFCLHSNDILIDHFIESFFRHNCRPHRNRLLDKPSKNEIMGYDLVEDFLERWARAECPRMHADRWGLTEGEVLCTPMRNVYGERNSEALKEFVAKDLQYIIECANNPPSEAKDWPLEERLKQCAVDRHIQMRESFKRAVYRVTGFSKLDLKTVRQIVIDHERKVLHNAATDDPNYPHIHHPQTTQYVSWQDERSLPFLGGNKGIHSSPSDQTSQGLIALDDESMPELPVAVEGLSSSTQQNNTTVATFGTSSGQVESVAADDEETQAPQFMVLGGNHLVHIISSSQQYSEQQELGAATGSSNNVD